MDEIDYKKDNENELSNLQAEAHYVHTINDFVLLIEDYGFERVMSDFRRMMGEREW